MMTKNQQIYFDHTLGHMYPEVESQESAAYRHALTLDASEHWAREEGLYTRWVFDEDACAEAEAPRWMCYLIGDEEEILQVQGAVDIGYELEPHQARYCLVVEAYLCHLEYLERVARFKAKNIDD